MAASWDDVARRFGVTVARVRVIEREGLDAQWTPLGDEQSGGV